MHRSHEDVERLEQRVRPNLRTSVGFGVLALAALVAGHDLHGHDGSAPRTASYACAAAVVVFGVLATRSTANEFGRVLARHAGHVAITPSRVVVQIVGYLLTFLAMLAVLQIDLSQFLVGGALTGIVLGIAAQQALGNFFAGLVLLLARPYAVGDRVTIYSGAINGPHEGTVLAVSLLYTTVQIAQGPLNVPNSILLGSAIGPGSQPDAQIGQTSASGPSSGAESSGSGEGSPMSPSPG